MTIEELSQSIGSWHVLAFPWANTIDCLIKLVEETGEAMAADKWGNGNLSDELADCLICVIAAFYRAGIDPEQAVLRKFSEVMKKYGQLSKVS